MPEIAIVGAGLTGLVAAYRLAAAGWRVTIFERYPEAGGLVATFAVGGERLECFYHHLFTTDADYLELAAELGLADEIEWLPSRMGIYSGGRLWDFGTPASLLSFRPLPWPDKLRFALSTLYLRQRSRAEQLAGITAQEWILRHAGRRAFDIVWGPLLAQKFADKAGEISMAWLAQKLFLRGRSRSPSGLGERLGYMRGSFGRLIDSLVGRLRAAGVELSLATPVMRVACGPNRLEIATRKAAARFDLVLFTASPAELARVLADRAPQDYLRSLDALDGTGAMCAVLELDRPLSPYYWLNVADPAFPFGGVIEHTNYVPAARYGGRHVVYLSRYLFSSHPLWRARDDEVWATYWPSLERLNPALDRSWVLARHVFRAAYAQPIVPCHYARLLPPFVTPIPGLYHACMAQIYPEDRGQSYAVRAGNRAAAALLATHGKGGTP